MKPITPKLTCKSEAAPALLKALKALVEDGECYCADGVSAKGVCGWCEGKSAIAEAEPTEDNNRAAIAAV